MKSGSGNPRGPRAKGREDGGRGKPAESGRPGRLSTGGKRPAVRVPSATCSVARFKLGGGFTKMRSGPPGRVRARFGADRRRGEHHAHPQHREQPLAGREKLFLWIAKE